MCLLLFDTTMTGEGDPGGMRTITMRKNVRDWTVGWEGDFGPVAWLFLISMESLRCLVNASLRVRGLTFYQIRIFGEAGGMDGGLMELT